jgi:cytochrome c peroxidase
MKTLRAVRPKRVEGARNTRGQSGPELAAHPATNAGESIVRRTLIVALASTISTLAVSGALPPSASYRNLPSQSFEDVKRQDEAMKNAVMEKQRAVLSQRYELADRPRPGAAMSGGRKTVQDGVRVRLPAGMTWDSLGAMTSQEIREKGALPKGFLPLPHVKQLTGGQVFPDEEINEIEHQEQRNLRRFDVDFDLPDRFTPEFPPPIFLTTHTELGDVSHGQVLTIKNYYTLMVGLITPVQLEGMRLLLTPFPQEEFNQTEDRKSADQSEGVTCLDCHVNFHSNAAFHQTPDVRPQAARFRLDTTSLRGLFAQQIHGSKRSLRSVEDFSEFEQRTAYFNGDHVSATRKGANLPDRPNQVAMMAQMQNIIDFPPAPKLDSLGRLIPELASEKELAGEKIFTGKGQCAACHIPQTAFMDQAMHDLKLERFYKPGAVDNDLVLLPDGPIKTFTLRGIKDSPPYLHDGRLLTVADTVEFFNLVLQLKLNSEEKDDLVAYLFAL